MAAPSGRASRRGPTCLKQLVNRIRSHPSAELENTLQEVQGLVRKSKGLDIVGEFRKLGGLDEVVKIVKADREEKITDLALSVLATCCREEESRLRVHQLEGISTLAGILNTYSSVSIINRASRALANLAETPKLSAAIHDKDVAPLLIKLLKESKDSNCQQSILRTVRMLADTCQHSWQILHSEGLAAVLSCLDSDDEKLVGNAAHTAAQLSSNLGSGRSTEALKSYLEAGKQAVEENGVEHLVGLLSHSKTSIQENALMTILSLMVSEDVRVAAGKAGAVEIFISRGCLKKSTSSSWATYVHCLCFCCREAVNRARVRDLEGFQVLLAVLKSSSEDCQRLHEIVLVALMDFYYDEQSLNYLAVCGFIPILVSQLRLEETCQGEEYLCGLDSKSPKGVSAQPDLADNKPSTSSDKMQQEKRQTTLQVGGCAKRVRTPSVDSDEVAHSSKQPCSSKGSSMVPTRGKTDSPQPAAKKARVVSYPNEAQPIKTSAESLIPSATRSKSRHSHKSTPTSAPKISLHVPSKPSSTSGMSPEGDSTNYHSYLNPEATPYSPPTVDWEWFWQHREQMGQDLSPRSFSSFSSPLSLSPPRFDFSPSSSPQWSPQWSPEQSPKHPSSWSSPQHSVTWSPQHAPQWSPIQSPQWEHPDQDECDAFPELNPGIELPRNEESTQSVPIQTGEEAIRNQKEVLLPTAGCLSKDSSSEIAGSSKEERSKKSVEAGEESSNFREPSSSSMKMRTGKSRTTSVSRQSSRCLPPEKLESDPDLLPFMESKEPQESLAAKFERNMEIRRAKEEGKLRRREYAVVTLLSRYSHMDDPSTHMAKASVIQVLMDYRPTSEYLQFKSQRTLHRILRNRLCFEQLILEHVPMLIAREARSGEKQAKLAKCKEDGIPDRHKKIQTKFSRSQSADGIGAFKDKIRSGNNSPQLMQSQIGNEPSGRRSMTDQSSDKILPDLDGESADFFEDLISDTTSECSTEVMELAKTRQLGDAMSLLDAMMVSTCPYRQGIMKRLLMLDSVSGKMACVLAVPYICQSSSLKRQLLIKHKGLEILTDYLQKGNKVPDMFTKAVQCLQDLSSSLFKKEEDGSTSKDLGRLLKSSDREANSSVEAVRMDCLTEGESIWEAEDSSVCGATSKTSSIECHLKTDQRPSRADHFGKMPDDTSMLPCKNVCHVEATEQKSDVTFLLDGDIVIEAHRDILTRHSEYFKCLLEGPFMESGQSAVPIKQISKEAFVLILHVLHGCRLRQCFRMQNAAAPNGRSVLEAIACSGRFLLKSVQDELCDILTEYFLDASNVLSHYQVGLKHNCPRLTTACLKYLLTNDQVSEKHFQEMVEQGYSRDAFRSIKQLISDALISKC